MKISKKNNNYYLTIDKLEYLVAPEVVLKYALNKKNYQLTEDIIKDIIISSAFNEALDFIKVPKTQFEVIDKLNTKYDKQTINKVITKLNELHLINDIEFLKNFIEQKINSYGKNYLLMKLRQKGIRDELINNELSNYNECDVLVKKIPLKLKQQKGSKRMIALKVINYFYQKGYDFDLVEQIVNLEIEKLNLDDTTSLIKDIKKLLIRFQGYKEDFLKRQKFIKVLMDKGYGYEEIIKYLGLTED